MTKDEILNKIADEMIKVLRKQIKQNNSYASGDLYNDIDVNFSNDTIKINMVDYAEYVDKGRRPGGMPPIDKIRKWASRKGLNINPYAIATNIAKYGVKARPFLFVLDNLNINNYLTMYGEAKMKDIKLNDKKIIIQL